MSTHNSLLSVRGKRVLSSKVGRRSGAVTKRWVKIEPRTLLYYKSFRAKKEAGSYALDASISIREPDRKKDTLLSDSRFAFCIDGLKERNGNVREDPIVIYADSRDSIELWRRAVREACRAGNKQEASEDKRTTTKQKSETSAPAVADSIKVFFSTSGYLLSQLSKNSEACADALMLADRATDAQVRVVYNIMASDRMKLSSLRPLPEPYVFGAVVLRALGEIGPMFPDEALVEWLRLFRAYSRSEATSKSKSIRSQQAIQVSTLLRLLPMKSMVLLEALFSFLYRSSTASSILTTLDTANLIKKYVVPKYPKGLGIDTKLWHKGMRRLLYLLLSNYDEIFVSSSASRNTTRTPPRVPPVTTTTREPEEREYEIESKRNRTKKKVRFTEEDRGGVELLPTGTSRQKEEEEEEKIDAPHSSSDEEEKKEEDQEEMERLRQEEERKRREERERKRREEERKRREEERRRQEEEKIKEMLDEDTSSGLSDLDEQHVFFSDIDDGSDSEDETLRMMRKNVPIDLDSSYNEKNKRVAAREQWKKDQEDRLREEEKARRERERIEMEARRQIEREEERKRLEEEEKERLRREEERKRQERERRRREEEEERRRREEEEERRRREEERRSRSNAQENHARIRQAALAAKERSDRERRHLEKRSSFNDISTIDFEYTKGRTKENLVDVDSGEEELFDMVERERRQERRILEAKRRRDEAKRAQEIAASKRLQNSTATTYEEDGEEDADMMSTLRERMEKRDRARAQLVSRIWEKVNKCNMLTSKARDSETVHENRKALRALMEEIHTLKASTKPDTSLQVMLKLLEENVNLSLNLYDYREDVVERTRIKQEIFLEQFNSSLAESPTVRSPSNSPPRSSRNDRTSTPSSSALLSTLTNRLWQRTPPQQTQQKDEYEDDDGAW